MKKLLLILLFVSSNIINAQFNGDWYTFRINEMMHYSISDTKIVIKRIGNYNTDKQHIAREESFTIKYKSIKNDSILYLVRNLNSDDLAFDESKLYIDKFIFNKKSNTLNNFYFETFVNFEKLKSEKTVTKNDIDNFIKDDIISKSYLTFYSIDSINKFLNYKKFIDQPREKIIELYKNLTLKYASLKNLSENEEMAYFSLRGLSKSSIRTPIYLNLSICPLLKVENLQEIELLEKFKDDKEVIDAINEFEKIIRQ